MKLWIDGQFLQTASRYRGIGRYVMELIQAFSEARPDVELSISFNAALADTVIAARNRIVPFIRPANIHLWHGVADGVEMATGQTPARVLSELVLNHHVACLGPDIALSASPAEAMGSVAVPYFPEAAYGIAAAGIFYDAIPYRFKDKYLASPQALANYIHILDAHSRFDWLLAISEYSRLEAQAFVPGASVSNINAGVSAEFRKLLEQPARPERLGRFNLPDQFLFYVGGFDWRKNVPGTIRAIASLPRDTAETINFVTAGEAEPESIAELTALWRSQGLPDGNYRHLGYVSEPELIELFRVATLLIQPSFGEGFGLTALEAMTCCTPVIAANAGALPEVVRNDEALFDPQDLPAMGRLIARGMTDSAFRSRLIDNGQRNSQRYSWAKTANRALDVLAMASHPAPHRSLDDIRAITLDRYRADPRLAEIFETDTLAELFAMAEPEPVSPPRCLIEGPWVGDDDQTAELRQLVAQIRQNAAGNSVAMDQMAPVIVCATETGFYARPTGKDGTQPPQPKQGEPIRLASTDRIVLLDSSTAMRDQTASLLREARLRGAEVISVIYDLAPILAPASCDSETASSGTAWLRRALGLSSGLICASQAIADDILKILDAMRFPRRMSICVWPLLSVAVSRPGPAARAPSESARDASFGLSGNWSTIYQPLSGFETSAFDDIGVEVADRALTGAELAGALEVVEGPLVDSGTSIRYVIGLTNGSAVPWFGRGKAGGKFAVGLICHMADGSIPDRMERVPVPYVIAPGQTALLPVVLDSAMAHRQGQAVLTVGQNDCPLQPGAATMILDLPV